MPRPENTDTARARDFLRRVLEAGPLTVVDVKDRARQEGLSLDVLGDASRQLGIERDRDKRGRVMRWGLAGSLDAGKLAAPAGRTPPPGERPVAPSMAALNDRLLEVKAKGRTVEIWRYEEGRPAYITAVAADDFTLEWLRRNLGGGRYVVSGLDDEIVISGQPNEYHTPGTAVVPVRRERERDREDERIGFSDRLLGILLEERRAQAGRQMTDPMQMALEIVKVVQAAQAVNPAGPRTSTGELVALLGELEKLGIDVGAMRDRPRDEPSVTETLTKFAPGFNQLAALIAAGTVKKNGAPLAVPVAALPAANGAAPTPPSGVATVSGMDPTGTLSLTPAGRVVLALAPNLSLVTAQAKMGVTGAGVAQYLCDHMGDGTWEDVDAAVDSGSFVDDVMRLGGPLIPVEYAAWYRELVTHVQKLALESRETGTDDDRPADS